jgi:hypothetical protein
MRNSKEGIMRRKIGRHNEEGNKERFSTKLFQLNV